MSKSSFYEKQQQQQQQQNPFIDFWHLPIKKKQTIEE